MFELNRLVLGLVVMESPDVVEADERWLRLFSAGFYKSMSVPICWLIKCVH